MTGFQKTDFPLTAHTADWIVNQSADQISTRAYAFAKHALLDYVGCATIGQGDPMMALVREEFQTLMVANAPSLPVHDVQACTMLPL